MSTLLNYQCEKPFRFLESDILHVRPHIYEILNGNVAALLIKGVLNEDESDQISLNFKHSKGIYYRDDGVSGAIVGPQSFLKNAKEIHRDYMKNHIHAELLFEGTRNVMREIYDLVTLSGYQFRKAEIEGVTSPSYRAVRWFDNTTDNDIVLKPHSDLPQAIHTNHEYNDVTWPVAVNLYPEHPKKGSFVRIYNFRPSDDWLEERGLKLSGYPIEESDLDDIEYMDLCPERGDVLLFCGNYVHSVYHSMNCGEGRLNINGFMGYSPKQKKVLAWV